MRELTDTELEAVSGGATAIEYGLIGVAVSKNDTAIAAVTKALG